MILIYARQNFQDKCKKKFSTLFFLLFDEFFKHHIYDFLSKMLEKLSIQLLKDERNLFCIHIENSDVRKLKSLLIDC